MEFNELQQARVAKLEQLRAAGQEPFPARVERSHVLAELRAQFAELAAEQRTVKVAGRIMLRRPTGGSCFAQIADESGRMQIFLSKKDIGAEAYQLFLDTTDLGDIIAVQGYPFHTRTGEATVFVQRWQMAAKALNPLPDKHAGLQDTETRLRRRYVDLVVNDEVRERFRVRARTIKAMRDFLDGRGFLEVETPMLHPVYGGAAARPFTTHHNQLHQSLYLRIAPELYLKRLIVGGYERVYEIGKDFRNEGVDRFHNPEFTAMECYQAYADYNDMMRLTEDMVASIAQVVLGSTTLTYGADTIKLDPPWQRVTMRDAIAEHTGIDIVEAAKLEQLQAEIVTRDVHVERKPTWAKLVDELFTTHVQPRLIQPTFIMDYPQPLSPLAKRMPDNPGYVERFQPFVLATQLGNAFSELNDPIDQEQRFLEQGRDYAAGDLDAMQMDVDYLNALMTGMPPTGGLGIGIDRLVMLFTNQSTIREVLLFPHLRQIEEGQADG